MVAELNGEYFRIPLEQGLRQLEVVSSIGVHLSIFVFH